MKPELKELEQLYLLEVEILLLVLVGNYPH